MTDARSQLLEQAVFQLTTSARPDGLPPALEKGLRDQFDELFRGAFAECIKDNEKVKAIFAGTMLAEILNQVEGIPRAIQGVRGADR